MMKMLAGLAAAVALLAAAPALAGEGEGCKNCPHHAKEAAAETKGTKVAEAEKKDEKKDEKACPCGAKEAKDCKCGDKCHCAHKDAKKDAKT